MKKILARSYIIGLFGICLIKCFYEYPVEATAIVLSVFLMGLAVIAVTYWDGDKK